MGWSNTQNDSRRLGENLLNKENSMNFMDCGDGRSTLVWITRTQMKLGMVTCLSSPQNWRSQEAHGPLSLYVQFQTRDLVPKKIKDEHQQLGLFSQIHICTMVYLCLEAPTHRVGGDGGKQERRKKEFQSTKILQC